MTPEKEEQVTSELEIMQYMFECLRSMDASTTSVNGVLQYIKEMRQRLEL